MFFRSHEFSVSTFFTLLLIFSLVVLSSIQSRVLKSLTIIVGLYTSLFNSIHFCFMYFGGPLLGAYVFIIAISFLMAWIFYNYAMSVFIFSKVFLRFNNYFENKIKRKKYILSHGHSIANLAFLQLQFARYIFLSFYFIYISI